MTTLDDMGEADDFGKDFISIAFFSKNITANFS